MRKEPEREIGEQLSALVDEELGRSERRFLLRRLANEPQHAETVRRYYLIRDVLQRNLPAHIAPGLPERVRAALEDEPAHRRPGRLTARATTTVGGLALAASVALVVVAIDPFADEPTPSEPETVAASDAPEPEVANGRPWAWQPQAPTWSFQQHLPVAQPSLPALHGWPAEAPARPGPAGPMYPYWLNHAEHASSGGMVGLINYSRIAGHERAPE